MRTYLIAALFLAVAGAVHAANPGDEVIVVYNTRMPGSKEVADYYAARRNVPSRQIFGFDVTTNEDISRREFTDSLEKPLAKKLESKKLWHIGSEIVPATNNSPGKVIWKVKESKIRYAVLCYGIPLRIDSDPNVKEKMDSEMRPELRSNGAAVDNELALLPCIDQKLPITGPIMNPGYTLTNAALLNPTNGILLVTRLDGPSAEIARGLVDKAMDAETNGLCGRAYIDYRSLGTNSPYAVGDQWMLGAGEICKIFGGFETIVDTNAATFPAEFPMCQIGIYCGWYTENASGPFAQKTVEFMPGAFAYHLHSFSAATIRSTTQHWVGPLLAKGATVTMGSVDEPYLSGTPDVSVFCARWIVDGFTFGEAAYACQQTLSWQTTVIGDPLYTPFKKSLKDLMEAESNAHNDEALAWTYLRATNLGLLHGRRPAEIAAFLQSLPLTQKSAVLTERLGDLFDELGKPASAVEAYENALKRDPSPEQRLRIRLDLAGKLTALNQTKEVCADLQALLDEAPDYPGRADVEQRLGNLRSKLGTNTTASASSGLSNP